MTAVVQHLHRAKAKHLPEFKPARHFADFPRSFCSADGMQARLNPLCSRKERAFARITQLDARECRHEGAKMRHPERRFTEMEQKGSRSPPVNRALQQQVPRPPAPAVPQR
jgi:hypothetical protein